MATYPTTVDGRDELCHAIAEHLDADQLLEVAEYGADRGWPGFTYYVDTVAFYDAHEGVIWSLLAELDPDRSGLQLAGAFPGARDVHSDAQFKTLLTLFALEYVAHAYESGDAWAVEALRDGWVVGWVKRTHPDGSS